MHIYNASSMIVQALSSLLCTQCQLVQDNMSLLQCDVHAAEPYLSGAAADCVKDNYKLLQHSVFT
jgi:hypothetical protein